MQLKVAVEDYEGNPVAEAFVELNAPEYDFIDTGKETGSCGTIEFNLPETYKEKIWIYLYVNGAKLWSDYVDSTGETLYLKDS
tara:strand:+ start:1003 stop:1251 length:249 start_codon:yes stop_codon:yes gene_type:complete